MMNRSDDNIDSRPTNLTLEAALEWHRLGHDGEELLGATGWSLFRSYGRVMSGPHSGRYVSALSSDETRRLLSALREGQRVPIHLMHRHRSGNYESSVLSLMDGRLVMHFADRSEPAE